MASRLVAVFSTFETLADPRIERTRRHELLEVIVVALCGTIAGADSWVDIERFWNELLDLLLTYLKLENGIPSHDTFGRVFAQLDPAQLMACLRQWIVDLNREIGSTSPSMARPSAARTTKPPAAIRCTWFRPGRAKPG